MLVNFSKSKKKTIPAKMLVQKDFQREYFENISLVDIYPSYIMNTQLYALLVILYTGACGVRG
jgi:hypothetical protein